METDNKNTKTVVSVENVFFSYDREFILNNVSLEIKEKDFLAIMGPNGGGKTTLAKLICGLYKPKAGKVLIEGKNAHDKKIRIGYVPQVANFDKKFPITVIDLVISGRCHSSLLRYSQADYECAMTALEMVQISALFRKKISDLSGGQLQRVMFARALASKADILLLDEPTSSVDPTSKTSIFYLLKELNASKTIIIITHDISVISSYVKTVACLNRTISLSQNNRIGKEMIETHYSCPVDIVAHGQPHRVFDMYHSLDEMKK